MAADAVPALSDAGAAKAAEKDRRRKRHESSDKEKEILREPGKRSTAVGARGSSRRLRGPSVNLVT